MSAAENLLFEIESPFELKEAPPVAQSEEQKALLDRAERRSRRRRRAASRRSRGSSAIGFGIAGTPLDL